MLDLITWESAIKFLEEGILFLTVLSTLIGGVLARKHQAQKEITEVLDKSHIKNEEYLSIAKHLGKKSAIKAITNLLTKK